jgi:hypothetical protein
MSAANPGSQQAVVEAALVLLERVGLSPADLTAIPQPRKPVPTFAEYVPVVSEGTRSSFGAGDAFPATRGTSRCFRRLTRLFVFLGKESGKHYPAQGNWQRQREQHRSRQAAGPHSPYRGSPDVRPQQSPPAGCVPPLGRGCR